MPAIKREKTLLIAALLFALGLANSLPAAEHYPLWDGHESVADYATRVTLPPTKTLDLGDNVKLELVLIPAGKFVMGTSEPVPVDEEGFRKKKMVGQALLAASVSILVVLLIVVVLRAIRERRRPQFSLRMLLLVTVTAGGCAMSGLQWRMLETNLERARRDYAVAKTNYDSNYVHGEGPARPVTLTAPIYMGKFLVTQEQYKQIRGSNPSSFMGETNPVENVSWDNAQVFCKKLSDFSGEAIRLPTEAQWEFSCRAGTTANYYSGNSPADLNKVAWTYANSNKTTHPVGLLQANAFGLYDMHGNVWEWCQDWYLQEYVDAPTLNPEGPIDGVHRVLRGGSFRDNPILLKSATRVGGDPRVRGIYLTGFRIMMFAESPKH